MTIEGALTELDRQGQERKDRGGEVAGANNASRGTSIDSIRSPTSVRSPTLSDVPEDDRFAIGDDDDNDEMLEEHQRRLSEKARGKQPAMRLSTTSRTASTSSIQTLSSAQSFRPSQEWLESWYAQLPLDTIFRAINEARLGRDVVDREPGSRQQGPGRDGGMRTPNTQVGERERKQSDKRLGDDMTHHQDESNETKRNAGRTIAQTQGKVEHEN